MERRVPQAAIDYLEDALAFHRQLGAEALPDWMHLAKEDRWRPVAWAEAPAPSPSRHVLSGDPELDRGPYPYGAEVIEFMWGYRVGGVSDSPAPAPAVPVRPSLARNGPALPRRLAPSAPSAVAPFAPAAAAQRLRPLSRDPVPAVRDLALPQGLHLRERAAIAKRLMAPVAMPRSRASSGWPRSCGTLRLLNTVCGPSARPHARGSARRLHARSHRVAQAAGTQRGRRRFYFATW